MRPRILLPFLLVFLALPVRATHIIGGEIFYDYLGSDNYQVTLKMFRDCGPNNTNGTAFDPQADIGVFDAAGNWLYDEVLFFPGSTTVPVNLNTPCLTVPPVICVEEADYTGVINLPSGTGGYTLAFQRCCRTPVVINVLAPNTQGLTCMVQVPDAAVVGDNSSPHFVDYPPIAMCLAEDMVFDNSAFDADGDQLTYELTTPLNGADQFNPIPVPPAAPPYAMIQWGSGYSQSYMMDASPVLAIDPVTGELTVTPTMIGSYTIGVMVKEFRSGVLLSEVRRDFRFDVVPCTATVVASIQQQQSLCTGTTIAFTDQSVGANAWHWDFGDPNTSADTSAQQSPTWTYADTGTYNVVLIANPSWSCADTSTATYSVHLPIDPQFVQPPIQCFDAQPVLVDATGNFTANASVVWDLGPAGVVPVINGDPANIAFTAPGTYPVTITVDQFGCTGTFTDTVIVYPNPVVEFDGDTVGCTPLDVHFTDLSSAWTPLSWKWSFGDGAGSTAQHPTHTFGNPGIFDVGLQVTTSAGCIDTVALMRTAYVTTWPQPVAGFTVSPSTVNVLDPTVLVTDGSSQAVQWIYYVEDSAITEPEFLYTFSDAGEFTITQVVSSSQLCADTATETVIVRDHLFYAPNAFTPNGDGFNEVFLPSVKGAKEYELDIFDRWGALLWSTTDVHEGWNGAGDPDGTYVYRVQLRTFSGQRKEYTGSVTLVR